MIHVNYHPDKFERMQVRCLPSCCCCHLPRVHQGQGARVCTVIIGDCLRAQAIWRRYVEGDAHALDRFPVGSCHNAPNC